MRWRDLVGFIVSWGLRRRPRGARHQSLAAALRTQSDLTRRHEVQTLSEILEKTWERELLEQGEARGASRSCRENLRMVLEERFGTLPEMIVRNMEAIENVERLRAAIRQALRIKSLDELQL